MEEDLIYILAIIILVKIVFELGTEVGRVEAIMSNTAGEHQEQRIEGEKQE